MSYTFVIIFIVVAGGLTALIMLGALGGLLVVARQRRAAGKVAADLGWSRTSHESFSGHVAGVDWRGGAYDAEDEPRAVNFEATIAGLSPGGFLIMERAAWPAWVKKQQRNTPIQRAFAAVDDAVDQAVNKLTGGFFDSAPTLAADECSDWPACEAGAPAWRQRWVLRASDARWATALTPEVEALWGHAQAAHPGALTLLVQHRRFNLSRNHVAQAPTLDDVVSLLRLGEALLESTLAVHAGGKGKT